MSADREGGPERPDYKVYRSRRGLLGRLRKPDLEGLSRRVKSSRSERVREQRREPERPRRRRPEPEEPRRRGRWLVYALVAMGAWVLVSFIAFAVSAQLQSFKLDGSVGDAISPSPLLATSAQNILVMGTDVRTAEFASDADTTPDGCIEAASKGEPPPAACEPYRADTLMVVRMGGGTFSQLSIPRDTYASIPGQLTQRINAAYAFGGAELQVEAVEQLLGIDINQVAIIDFDGFRELIDAVGGVKVELGRPICSSISGGAFNLELRRGEHTLNGYQALTLARTRASTCGPAIDDLDRTRFQQQILSGIQSRLTSPWRLPHNFIRGPWIGWSAPRTMVSSMGAVVMPQLALAAAIGGGNDDVLRPSGPGPQAGTLFVPVEECVQRVRRLLGGDRPPREPQCSPGF